jgi:hypothetical protein
MSPVLLVDTHLCQQILPSPPRQPKGFFIFPSAMVVVR